jgi:hypothetical protein
MASNIDFSYLRANAKQHAYFTLFPQLRTLGCLGLRLDEGLNSRGIERGLALHVHEARNLLLAHQWAYNGTQKNEVCLDKFAAYAPEASGEFLVYQPEKDALEGPADQNRLAIFRHCLDLAFNKWERSDLKVCEQLKMIPTIRLPDASLAIAPLNCGSLPGAEVQSLRFDVPPLWRQYVF